VNDPLFWGLSALAVAGASTVVFTKDVLRLALGLGLFLLALAGFFALFGLGFLALAEIFVYVGGVLVLVLFAIMLVHRTQSGAPSLESRHDPVAAVAVAGICAFSVFMLRPLAQGVPLLRGAGVDALGGELLGRMLPQFELAGILLLAALVAVVSISGGDER
jgi:NADH-quinone oxidoreductase subunit J